MGLTLLKGLVMGTCCGDIDLAIPAHLQRVTRLAPDGRRRPRPERTFGPHRPVWQPRHAADASARGRPGTPALSYTGLEQLGISLDTQANGPPESGPTSHTPTRPWASWWSAPTRSYRATERARDPGRGTGGALATGVCMLSLGFGPQGRPSGARLSPTYRFRVVGVQINTPRYVRQQTDRAGRSL